MLIPIRNVWGALLCVTAFCSSVRGAETQPVGPQELAPALGIAGNLLPSEYDVNRLLSCIRIDPAFSRNRRLQVTVEFPVPVLQSDLEAGNGLIDITAGPLEVTAAYSSNPADPPGYTRTLILTTSVAVNPNHVFFVRYARGFDNTLTLWLPAPKPGGFEATVCSLPYVPSIFFNASGSGQTIAVEAIKSGEEGFSNASAYAKLMGAFIALDEDLTDAKAKKIIDSWLRQKFGSGVERTENFETAIISILDDLARFQVGGDTAYLEILDYLYESAQRNPGERSVEAQYRELLDRVAVLSYQYFQRHFASSPMCAAQQNTVDDDPRARYAALRMLEAVANNNSEHILIDIISHRKTEFVQFVLSGLKREVAGQNLSGAATNREQQGLAFAERILARVERNLQYQRLGYTPLICEVPQYAFGGFSLISGDTATNEYEVSLPVFFNSLYIDAIGHQQMFALNIARNGRSVSFTLSEYKVNEPEKPYIVGTLVAFIEDSASARIIRWNVPRRNFDMKQSQAFRYFIIAAALKYFDQIGIDPSSLAIDGAVFQRNRQPWDLAIVQKIWGFSPDLGAVRQLIAGISEGTVRMIFNRRGSGRLGRYPYFSIGEPISGTGSAGSSEQRIPLFLRSGREGAGAGDHVSVDLAQYEAIMEQVQRARTDRDWLTREFIPERYFIGSTQTVTDFQQYKAVIQALSPYHFLSSALRPVPDEFGPPAPLSSI